MHVRAEIVTEQSTHVRAENVTGETHAHPHDSAAPEKTDVFTSQEAVHHQTRDAEIGLSRTPCVVTVSMCGVWALAARIVTAA